MSLFSKDKVPQLTREVMELCQRIDALPNDEKQITADCVLHLYRGIGALGSLPSGISESVKDVVFTLVQKMMFSAGNSEKMSKHLQSISDGMTGFLKRELDSLKGD